MTSPPVVLVAGAVSHEYLIYPMSTQHGGFLQAHSGPNGDQNRVVVRSGGAELISQLLTAVAPEHGLEVFGPVAQSNGTSYYKEHATALVDLTPQLSQSSGRQSFGVVQVKNVGDHHSWKAPNIGEAIQVAREQRNAPESVEITSEAVGG